MMCHFTLSKLLHFKENAKVCPSSQPIHLSTQQLSRTQTVLSRIIWDQSAEKIAKMCDFCV